MCEPVTAATLAITAISSAMAYQGQANAAKAEQSYQDEQFAATEQFRMDNARAANDAYIDEAAQQNLALMQEQAASSTELLEVQRQSRQRVGNAVASSESAGLSLDALLSDFYRQDAGYRDTTAQQLSWSADQAQRNIQGFRSKAEARGNSIQPYIRTPVQNPSIATPFLQTAGAGLSAYGAHLDRQPRTLASAQTKAPKPTRKPSR